MKHKILTGFLAGLFCTGLKAQQRGDPSLTEIWHPVPKPVMPGMTDADASSDAVVLFNGKEASQWQAKTGGPFNWKVHSRALTVVPYASPQNGLPKKIAPFYGSSTAAQKGYKPLFNGKDLDGWDVFLKGKTLNEDSEQAFQFQDSVLYVKGKELGYIRTKKSFTNYHFVVDFKWGEKKWPPREGAKRDAGICYNIPPNEPDSIWPQSIECQIQEGDVGDFWLLSFCTITVNDSTNKPANHTRMVKKADGEKPSGEWNTVEVISYKGRCVHIVNGVVVNEGEKASVRGGRILLQSEYAELWYRNPRIKKL